MMARSHIARCGGVASDRANRIRWPRRRPFPRCRGNGSGSNPSARRRPRALAMVRRRYFSSPLMRHAQHGAGDVFQRKAGFGEQALAVGNFVAAGAAFKRRPPPASARPGVSRRAGLSRSARGRPPPRTAEPQTRVRFLRRDPPMPSKPPPQKQVRTFSTWPPDTPRHGKSFRSRHA